MTIKTEITRPTATTPLRERMIADMAARKLHPLTQKAHIRSCKRFAAFLGRSPETATVDDVKAFQLHMAGAPTEIATRNRVMTGVKFLLRVTMRRHDLAAEIYHLREPKRVPLILSQDEARHLLASATSLKARTMLTLAYGCGLRAGEVTRLKVGDIDRERKIIRIVQSKGAPRRSRLRQRTGRSCFPMICTPCCASGGWSVPSGAMQMYRQPSAISFPVARQARI